MLIPVGISNRHVHLTNEDWTKLFGNKEMTLKANLKQPDNFACEEVVTIKTEKNVIENVRVLGPCRNYTQIEISLTDARTLGINPPIRQSGDVINSGIVTIIGPCGSITTEGCIIPGRHIHITKEEKDRYNLPDVVSLKVDGIKGGIIGNVELKIADKAFFEVHLDTDEANAFNLKNNQELEIIL